MTSTLPTAELYRHRRPRTPWYMPHQDSDLSGSTHPRRIGWFGAAGLAMGGSNQVLFLIAGVGGLVYTQGSAAIALLILGLVVSWMAVPGWIELGCMFPNRVGGIAATCAEAFRPYSPVLANLTGTCYWWGWVPTCGLTAFFAASALHSQYLHFIPVLPMAICIVIGFAVLNICGLRYAAGLAGPMALLAASLALISGLQPILFGHVDWQQAFTWDLTVPFKGTFGTLTSAMAGIYLIGFAAPAFEAAACHVGEMRQPDHDHPAAMWAAAGMATVYFILLPIVWLGVFGPHTMAAKSLIDFLGPTFAPLFGAASKSAAIWFMTINMLHGTIQPLSGASRTLSQLSDDGLLPKMLGKRLKSTDAPWFAICLTALAAIVFLLLGHTIALIAAANLCYLIGIGLPSIAVWLLRRDQPDRYRPYLARTGMISLGLLSAFVWLAATIFGFSTFALQYVIFGLALAFSGSLMYAWRVGADRRAAGRTRKGIGGIHLKLTGAMLLVLVLDSAGYLVAVTNLPKSDPALLTTLEDTFVVVALLTISVGLILPGMIAHTVREVAEAAADLSQNTLREITETIEDIAVGNLDGARIRVSVKPVSVTSNDELGSMAESFNEMQDEAVRVAAATELARAELLSYRNDLEAKVADRTRALVTAQAERKRLLERQVEIAEEERSRFAAELHDGPLQNLASLVFLLDRAQLSLEKGDVDTAFERLGTAQGRISQEVAALREIMSGLRPPALDDQSLEVALEQKVAAFAAATQIEARCAFTHRTKISKPLETVVFRIASEALINVAKHAEASRVLLSSRDREGDIEFIVQDNGVGFNFNTRSTDKTHYGIDLMRERVESVGGTLELASVVGKGTKVTIIIPKEKPWTWH